MADGGGGIPPEAAVFDLTAATLENGSETRTLDLNRPTPATAGNNLVPPEICQPNAIILSDTFRLPNGEVLEGEFSTDLLVSGQAGGHTTLAAFTIGGWMPDEQADLANLICEALWDWNVLNLSSDDFKSYNNRIRFEIELLLEHADADATERQTTRDIYQTFTAQPEMAVAAARQLSLTETAD